jgi:nickel/cobalt exporter
MTFRRITLLTLLLIAMPVLAPEGGNPALAARNPFISGDKTGPSQVEKSSAGHPAFLHPVMQNIAMAQQAIRQRMVRLARDIERYPLGRSFQLFMLFSLAYGVVHALGPGHGKIYACAYFLNRPGTIRSGLLLSAMTMVVHVFSGAALVLAGAYILKTSGAMALENAGAVLERISYALLTGLGMFLLVRSLQQLRSGQVRGHKDITQPADMRGLLFTALAVGIVPCPGAATILLFSLTLGILPAGLAAMVSIAAGMSITTALFSLLAIGLKGRFLVMAESHRRLFRITHAFFTLGGAACITGLGAVLLMGGFPW